MIAKSAVPNSFTLGNLTCGLLSLVMTFKASPYDIWSYKWACIFILLAGLFDRYDGRVARFLKVSSDLGKELDSLADLVSFGVAPSILAFNMYDFSRLGVVGYLLVVIFPLAGAYRLARYNTTTFTGTFMGVPITIAGTVVALYALISVTIMRHATNNPSIMILLILAFSYLMVSKLKLKKV